ncbi:radical SAM protein [Candidatus Micrarchaeota archaeon]|jgi:MoaA/NifB/PqqE/SkfB family radical SAM enzyme|nr:radical SAM protein [Candidatus Micrarchaeota archaeon]
MFKRSNHTSLRDFARMGLMVANNADIRDAVLTAFFFVDHHLRSNRSIESGVWHPSVNVIEMTYGCPRNCRECYIPLEKRRDSSIMDPAIIEKTITESKNLGISLFVLVGGEVLSEQMMPILESTVRFNKNCMFVVCTNGDYIAKQGIGALAKVHNISFSVSIDGFKEEHDFIRGHGSFDNTSKAMDVLRDSRKAFFVSSTVRNNNEATLFSSEFNRFLKNKGVVYQGVQRFRSPNPEWDYSSEKFSDHVSIIKNNKGLYPVPIIHVHMSDDLLSQDTQFSYIITGRDGDIRIGKVEKDYGNIKDEPLSNIIKRVRNG